MNSEDRLNLQQMIKDANVEDQTEFIREKMHSSKIRAEVKKLVLLKKNNCHMEKSDKDKFDDLCMFECRFLFCNYMDIFNKIKKEEINLEILDKFLDVLKEIEEGMVDQHEGSYKVGQLLKELYVDSALKKADKLNEEKEMQKEEKKEGLKITWSEYKLAKNREVELNI